MAPDLNSLPPSPTLRRTPDNMTSTTEHHPSPHSPSLSSLQAAAAINAGMRNSNSPRATQTQRRRSSLMTNLHLNDAQMPGPGEIQDPTHHHRAPSLGQMHQELENEQEHQVNRLLHMIRLQQDQIDELHADPSTTASASDSDTRPRTLSSSSRQQPLPQRPVSLSRHSSQAVSVTSGPRSSSRSPALRPVASPYDSQREDWLLGANRDESAFYQAETQMLTRENQMLKARIRELERQLAHPDSSPTHHQPPTPHSPAVISPLTSPPVISEPTRRLHQEP
ncbi:unnamed protein product [Aureobasidium mustum]|uniref:Uncharacterized protein n=1 Tax=Aureobasidium mustum TaxID=2773714 RepID=A0A9N8K766_9PEZI|nr:unnamed protein product [Aureobasidium mustum]